MAASVSVYDFLSEESAVRWKALLQPALRKVSNSRLLVHVYASPGKLGVQEMMLE